MLGKAPHLTLEKSGLAWEMALLPLPDGYGDKLDSSLELSMRLLEADPSWTQRLSAEQNERLLHVCDVRRQHLSGPGQLPVELRQRRPRLDGTGEITRGVLDHHRSITPSRSSGCCR